MVTKTEKLKKALAHGQNVSTARLRRVTGLSNLSSTVHRLREQLREEGVQIYTNKRGNQTFYRLAA